MDMIEVVGQRGTMCTKQWRMEDFFTKLVQDIPATVRQANNGIIRKLAANINSAELEIENNGDVEMLGNEFRCDYACETCILKLQEDNEVTDLSGEEAAATWDI